MSLSVAMGLRTVATLAAALAWVAYLAASVQADRRDHALCVGATGLPCSAVVQVRRASP